MWWEYLIIFAGLALRLAALDGQVDGDDAGRDGLGGRGPVGGVRADLADLLAAASGHELVGAQEGAPLLPGPARGQVHGSALVVLWDHLGQMPRLLAVQPAQASVVDQLQGGRPEAQQLPFTARLGTRGPEHG